MQKMKPLQSETQISECLRRNYQRNFGCQQNYGIAEAEECMGIRG